MNIEDLVIEYYLSGAKIKDIVDKTGIHVPGIYKILRENGIKKKNREILLSKDEKEEVVRRFLANEPANGIAKDFNLSKTNIYDIIKSLGYETNREGVSRNKLDLELNKAVLKAYNEKTPLKVIKSKFNFNSDTSIYIRVVANRYNMKKDT